jgi:ABC-type glycerol-3-phosphate transport system substrate-binding protein
MGTESRRWTVVGAPAAGRVTRGRLLQGGLGATVGLLAAACGAATSGDGTGAPLTSGAPVELEYWHTNAEPTPLEQGRVAALKAAEAANPQLFRIKTAEPGGASLTKVVAAAAAGTPPNLKIDYPYNAAQLWIKGALIDYDQQLKGHAGWRRLSPAVPATFQDGVRWLGHTVGLPVVIGQQAMMYAPDKLERAGVKPPAASWTWSDFEDLSKRAARPPDVWGLSVGWRSSTWQLFSGSNGVRWINKEQTRVSLTQPESMAGVEFLNRYTFGLKLMPLENNQKTAGEMLVTGRTVFEPQQPGRLPDLRKAGITRLEALPWPRGPQKPTAYNWGTLWATFVFKNADVQKERAALQAAVDVLREDAQMAHAVVDLSLPVSKSAKDSAAFQKFLAGDPLFKQFIDMFPSCDVWPAVPSGGDMRSIVDTAMADLYAQQGSMKDAFANAERELQRIHDEYVAQTTAQARR